MFSKFRKLMLNLAEVQTLHVDQIFENLSTNTLIKILVRTFVGFLWFSIQFGKFNSKKSFFILNDMR